ncbi:MAG: PKD domain-containing protein [Flavisolibacter sp.]
MCFYRIILLLLIFTGFSAGSASAQDFSNKGTEFWLAYSYHVGMVNTSGGAPEMTLYITADNASTYNVEVFGGSSIQSGAISAGQVVTVSIPNSLFIDDEGNFTGKAIHVTASSPVVVYSYITARRASAATLCLPAAVLGKEYISSAFTQASNESSSNSFITIVAVEDNTTVEIVPSADTKGGKISGTPYTVSLNQGEIYQVLGKTNALINGTSTGTDLTGTRITSIDNGSGGCKNIAVFSGSGKVSNQCGSFSGDNLYQQLYPLVTWGLKYLTVPSYNRPVNYYRVIRSDPATNVTVNGTTISAASFTNGYYEFKSDKPNLITADKPISVAQYFLTQGCEGNMLPSDPDMIMLNPVEQNIDRVTLINSNLFEPTGQEHNIHVVMKNTGSALTSFRFDGASVPLSSWKTHPEDPTFSYLYLSNVSQGFHQLTSDSGFNAIAYGFANQESYGYAAGANVKDLYQFMSIKNEYATVDFPAACSSSPFQFRMTFPYQPDEIQWIFGAALNGMGIADVTTTNPAYDSSWVVNGRTLYRYTLSNSYMVSATGSYPVKVIAKTAAACGNLQEINYTLNVYDRPKADFDFSGSGCVPVTLNFIDKSNTGGRSPYIWNWQVSDGQTSAEQNPQLTFTAGGTYTVSFSLVTDIGCVAAPVSKTVNITALPVADFSMNADACAGSPVSFTDASPNASSIKEWKWNFGDGTGFTVGNGQPVSHTWSAAGTYTVSLTVTSATGCTGSPTLKQVTIHPLPQPAFSSPGSCLADPFTQFTDASTIADGTEAGFIYLWNFGDANASASNPNTSTLKNPQHTYTQAGLYTVTQQVTSAQGCVASTTGTVSINGVPKAAFSVQGGNEFCSSAIISLSDNSTIDYGQITALEIYWDDGGNAADKSNITNPQSGGTYSHTYSVFATPATKQYTIRMVVQSGATCSATTTDVITLKSAPDVFFNALPEVCADAPAFLLSGAGEVNGAVGTGVFSGAGVDAAGNLDPLVAGTGTHTIRFEFTGNNGCSNYKEQMLTVHGLPQVNAGPDRVVVQGMTTTLLATATGDGLVYNWTPATGLNNSRALQPQVSPAGDLVYTLTATSAFGCTASDDVLVKVVKDFVVPNVFTPNGDGVNDTWQLDFVDPSSGATVKIFNRYGQVVFESKGYGKRWEGRYKGKDVPAGTYYYIIDLKNDQKPLTGFVDIVR